LACENEEGLADLGWEFVTTEWHEQADPLSDLLAGLQVGADHVRSDATDLSAELARLRAALLPSEALRFRDLGRRSADAMGATIERIAPGDTEHEIAAALLGESEARGVQAIVALVATDERVYRFRHPPPTDKRLDKYAMVVLCGRRQGLVSSITRLVHFGPMPDELRRKQRAVARVDAAFIGATRPGARLSEVFARAVQEYAAVGFPDEWRRHHQGGPAGYEPREYLGTPTSEGEKVVAVGQVYAWNPSVAGIKSEDTILVGQADSEVLTTIDGWPLVAVELDGRSYTRPAVLEVE